MTWRSWASGCTPLKPGANCPPIAAKTAGMPWMPRAWASRWLASTSTLASTQAPLPSMASFSRIGESCLHGSHHSAQKSMTTGVRSERSSTSLWKVASVTSMIVTPPPPPPVAGSVGATGRGGAGAGAGVRSALRSTAPRVKIEEAVRGSLLMVT
jgi:hypothetical protein